MGGGVAVHQFDDQPVAVVEVNLGRGVAHADGCHLDPHHLSGRLDGDGGSNAGDLRGSWIHADADHDGSDQRGQAGDELAGGEDGRSIHRGWLWRIGLGDRILTCRDECLSGGDAGPQAEHHQRQETRHCAEGEQRPGHLHPTRGRQKPQHQAAVDRDQAEGASAVEPGLSGPHDTRATPQHRGEQVGQRAGEHLKAEAGAEGCGRPGEPLAHHLPVGRRGKHPAGPGEPDHQPHQTDGHRGRSELAGWALSDGAPQPASPQAQARDVDDDPQRGDCGDAGKGAANSERDCAGQHRQGLPGPALGGRVKPRAEHCRPQREQRASEGEAHPAEHVGKRVGYQQPSVPRVRPTPGKGHAEPCTKYQRGRGPQVVPDGDLEPRRQCLAQHSPQDQAVPAGCGRHRETAGEREQPPVGGYPDHDGGGAAGDQSQPCGLTPGVLR